MKPNTFIRALFLCAVLAGCENTAETPLPEPGDQLGLSVGIEAVSTRTWLDSSSGASVLPVYWSDGDRINVNGQNSAPLELSDDSAREAEFLLRSVTPPYNAIYPAEIVSSDTYVDGAIEITIPSVQQYAAGSFGSGAAILYGYSEDETSKVSMLNACAAVRVRLWGDASTVIEDALLNSATTPLSGRYTLKPQDGTLTAVEGTNNLALALGEGVALSPEGTWFYFAIPAGEYADSLMFTFTQKSDRRSMKCKWTPDEALQAGVLYSFSSVEYVPGAKDIETPDDWNEFAACVNEGGDMRKWLRNGAAHLGADLNAEDLAQVKGDFIWEFDGQGHTITRTAGSVSLFRNVHGTVKNLNLAGSVTAAGVSCGVLADSLYAGGSITDCTSEATLTVNAESGSIAGAFAAVMTGGFIGNCINRGPVTVNADCSEGTIEDLIVGGIVGKIDAGLPSSFDATLKDCINSGALLADPTYTLETHTYGIKHAGIGGIAGWLCGTGHSFRLDNCDNTGSITYSAANIVSKTGLAKYQVSVGGIVGIAGDINYDFGVFSSSVGTDGIDAILSNCDNSGTVYNCGINYSATGESHNKVYTGGIAGSLIGTAEKRARLDSCRNTGNLIPYDLTGADASTRALYSQVAGGLIGYGGNVDMDACFSSCTIGNGKRQMYSLAGAIGLVIRPFSVTNSTIWFTGYFNRYNSNNHTNSASVACPPVKFGSTTVSPAPALGKYVITGCAVGAKLYYYNAPNTGTDDYSSKCTSSTTLTSGGSHIVRGFSYANEPPYCETGYVVSGNTSITAAP